MSALHSIDELLELTARLETVSPDDKETPASMFTISEVATLIADITLAELLAELAKPVDPMEAFLDDLLKGIFD